MLPSVGDVVDDKYRIVRLVGEGGMGSVFEAKHEVLGTPVALKFLDPELAKNPLLVARFLQEARVSATVRSPHVVQVFDVSSFEGGAYLVMEMLTGESLGERLEQVGRLERDTAIEIALQILAGLEVAHGLGVVHRDLKPDNVFITAPPASVVKILDFGIAKLKHSADFGDVVTRPGSMMGTPAYMAPEQAIAAERVDQRADIYSVGVILYEMLTGHLPVDSDEPSEIIEKVMKRQTVPVLERDPTLPVELAELVTSALVPNPAERRESAAELRLALTALAKTLSPSVVFAGAASSLTPSPSSVLDAPQSRLPKTIPPEEPGPPRSLLGSGPSGSVALEAGGTVPDAVPRESRGTGTEASYLSSEDVFRGTGTAPPGLAPPFAARLPGDRSSHQAAGPARRGGGRAWLFVTLVLVSGAAVALVGYLGGWYGPTSGQPPPLPAPPRITPTARELDVPQTWPRSSPSPRPRPRSGGAPRIGPSPAPPPAPSPPAGVPLPTIQLPSALPLPPGLPTLLPPGFPGASPGVAPTSSATSSPTAQPTSPPSATPP